MQIQALKTVCGNYNKNGCKVRQVISSCLTRFVCPIYLVHEESWCSMVSYDRADGGPSSWRVF